MQVPVVKAKRYTFPGIGLVKESDTFFHTDSIASPLCTQSGERLLHGVAVQSWRAREAEEWSCIFGKYMLSLWIKWRGGPYVMVSLSRCNKVEKYVQE